MENRLSQMFHIICQSGNESTIQELSQQLSVSTRSIYNDIKKLNEFLEASGYTVIRADKGRVFYREILMIEFENLIDASSSLILLNPQIRRRRIAATMLLHGNQFTLEELQKDLDVSRNTLLCDLKEIKELLGSYGIELEAFPFKGYQVNGNEKNIRNLLVTLFAEDFLFFNSEVEKSHAQLITGSKVFLDSLAKQLDVELSDVSFQRMLLAFFVTNLRSAVGKALEGEGTEPLTKEGKLFINKRKVLEELFEQEISTGDCLYLAEKFTEASLVKYKELLSEKWLPFHLVTNQFIEAVSKEFSYNKFMMDSMLFEGLLNHLRPAYKRAVSGEWIENPLLEYVLDNFSELNGAVKKGATVLETALNVEFNDHEIAYFTLFFASVLERNEKKIRKVPSIIIVCNAGISTSEILKSRLQAIFNVNILGTFSVRNAADWLADYTPDFIISTVSFQWKDMQVLKVSPYLSENDIKQIRNKLSLLTVQIDLEDVMDMIDRYAVMSEKNRLLLKQEMGNYFGISAGPKGEKGIYQPMLKEILTIDLIEAKFSAASRDEAVAESGRLLVDKQLAEPSYIEAMLKNVEVNGTYIVIAPGIAMPHARPEEGARGIGFSIVTLKEPVVFGHPLNDPVKIVVGLCAIDHQSHLKALTELADILMNQEKVEQMINAQSAEEIMNIIKGELSC